MLTFSILIVTVWLIAHVPAARWTWLENTIKAAWQRWKTR